MNPGEVDARNGRPHKRKRGPYKLYLDPSCTSGVPKSTLDSRRKAEGGANQEPLGAPRVPPVYVDEIDINLPLLLENEAPVGLTPEEEVSADVNPLLPLQEDVNPALPPEGDVPALNLPLEELTNNSEELHDGLAADEGQDENVANQPGGGGGVGTDYVKKYNLTEKLHRDFPHSRLEVLLMILHLALRHANTEPFIRDQIKFVNALFGDNVIDISYYLFKQIFKPSTSIQKHYFCDICDIYLGKQDDFPEDQNFTECTKCNKKINVKSVDSGNYFITLSLKDQIEALLENPQLKFVDHLQRTGNVILDIHDGQIFKMCSEHGSPFANENALSVTFNTDGAAVFKSTKNSLWPIQLYLNEIVPEQRFKTENLVLGGLWFGKSAPNMALYLKPFLTELLSLSQHGVRYRKPDGSTVFRPVYGLACSVDSVAKAKVLCQKQFNAYEGCLYCLHPNKAFVGDNRRQRFYDTSSTYPLRSEGQVIEDMFESDALERRGELKDDSVHGFVGLSILLMFTKYLDTFTRNPFNIVWSVVIDYMHAILEGVTADLLNLYESILSEAQLSDIDSRIKKITPPQGMTRRPRSIKEKVHWKAKEFRAFLLYYALPCLDGILPARNFAHLKLLVTAIHILLKDKILPRDLLHARSSLDSFATGFQRLYGLSQVTYNLHLCTHLVDQVIHNGPLWSYSNFIFESGNGQLLKLVRGTRNVIHEIAVKYTTLQTVSKFIRDNPVSDYVLTFCTDVLSCNHLKTHQDFHGIHVTGSESVATLDFEESAILMANNIAVSDQQVKFYNIVIRKGIVYCSRAYSKAKVFDDSCIMLVDGSYAVIEKFFSLHQMNWSVW